jgi:hypothetical protein
MFIGQTQFKSQASQFGLPKVKEIIQSVAQLTLVRKPAAIEAVLILGNG